MKNARIALRLTQTERKRLEALIKTGKFKTISEIVREALKQFLDTQVGSNIRSLKTNCMRENY
ncbi:MAG: ribbon-helix-helix domain-containing protein [Candidatus Bathyarchaeia archaeon]